uniref:Uncharacterized protein n=1 Tax=Arion vulgaris TaxID=1028688 RepID=A0A0B6ZUP7_9EUPU
MIMNTEAYDHVLPPCSTAGSQVLTVTYVIIINLEVSKQKVKMTDQFVVSQCYYL